MLRFVHFVYKERLRGGVVLPRFFVRGWCGDGDCLGTCYVRSCGEDSGAYSLVFGVVFHFVVEGYRYQLAPRVSFPDAKYFAVNVFEGGIWISIVDLRHLRVRESVEWVIRLEWARSISHWGILFLFFLVHDGLEGCDGVFFLHLGVLVDGLYLGWWGGWGVFRSQCGGVFLVVYLHAGAGGLGAWGALVGSEHEGRVRVLSLWGGRRWRGRSGDEREVLERE